MKRRPTQQGQGRSPGVGVLTVFAIARGAVFSRNRVKRRSESWKMTVVIHRGWPGSRQKWSMEETMSPHLILSQTGPGISLRGECPGVWESGSWTQKKTRWVKNTEMFQAKTNKAEVMYVRDFIFFGKCEALRSSTESPGLGTSELRKTWNKQIGECDRQSIPKSAFREKHYTKQKQDEKQKNHCTI